MSADNHYLQWKTTDSRTLSSTIVLDYTKQMQAVSFARVLKDGRNVPAIYIPDLARDRIYMFENDLIVELEELSDAQVRLRMQVRE